MKENPLKNDVLLRKKLDSKKKYDEEQKLIKLQKDLGINDRRRVKRIIVERNLNSGLSGFNHSQEKNSKFVRSFNSDSRSNSKNRSLLSNSSRVSYSVNKKLGNPLVSKLKITPSIRNMANINLTTEESMTSKRRVHPLFKLNLEISDGISEMVTFYPHHQVDTIAYDLSIKYNLKNEKYIMLRNILQENYNKYIEENRTN